MIAWDPIAPGERLQSGINWAPRLGSDTIASGGSTWSAVTPAGPTTSSPTVVGQVAYIWIENCTLGVVYEITNTVLTNGGQIEIETAQFVCAKK
jgi:hypothetical protein